MFETPYDREAMFACNPEAVLTCTEMKHEEEIRERDGWLIFHARVGVLLIGKEVVLIEPRPLFHVIKRMQSKLIYI